MQGCVILLNICNYHCSFQVDYVRLAPLVVAEGDSMVIGSELILSDVDSSNSIVYIDRILVEVIDGSQVERLYFTNISGDSGMYGENPGSLLQPVMNNNSSVILL